MNYWDLMRSRHSVRAFLDKPIDEKASTAIKNEIQRINAIHGLDFSLILDEPEAFNAFKKKYGRFVCCKNYVVLAAPKGKDEEIGYYGEYLVLLAQSLGLNSCWVALTYDKSKVPFEAPADSKIYVVIALGYGVSQGVAHKTKPIERLAKISNLTPMWFKMGMDAAALAPTAINQQRFYFELVGSNTVRAKALFGPCSKIDLGIVKYHFELGAGKDNFKWE